MTKSVNILDDKQFQAIPPGNRESIFKQLHGVLLESSMSGGYVESLMEMRREDPARLRRYVVFVMRTDDEAFPAELRGPDVPIYHRETLCLDADPLPWELALPGVRKRAATMVGVPTSEWEMPSDQPGVDTHVFRKPADCWGLTYVGGAAIAHGIDLDVMKGRLDERRKPIDTPSP